MKLTVSHPCGKRIDWREFSHAKDGNTEEWRQEEYDKNAANSYIPIGDAVFSFLKKFDGGSFLIGLVVGIQLNDKRKYKLREYFFVVTILSRNIKITWVGRKQRIVAKAADY